MGRTLECDARIDGKKTRGTALLETDEVLFRGGAARARVPFASVKGMAIQGEWLAITHAGGLLELALGKSAPKWEEGIRSPKGLVQKLGVKAGERVALVGMEGDPLERELAAVGATVKHGAPRAEVDVIFLRVTKEAELPVVAGLAKKIAADGAVWIVRPKGKGGVDEQAVFVAGHAAGLVDVKVARFSEAETALKFVVPKAARAKRSAAATKGR
jgi:hypothetical protein